MLRRRIPPSSPPSSPPATKNTLIIPKNPHKIPDLPPKIAQNPHSDFTTPAPAPTLPSRLGQRTLNHSLNQPLTKIPEISQESPNSSVTSSVASSQRINADELQKFICKKTPNPINSKQLLLLFLKRL